METGGGSGGSAPSAAPDSGGSSPSSSASNKRKARGGSGGQPPRCQVEGCGLDLTDVKAYYSRHKVCKFHSKSPRVVVAGIDQRFCQQCSRFHRLTEFDQVKRSCRRRLADHNERRRKQPPISSLSSPSGRLTSSSFGNSGTGGGFAMDLNAWPVVTSSGHVPDSQTSAVGQSVQIPWQDNYQNPSSDLLQLRSAGESRFSSPGIVHPSRECFEGLATDSSCALSLLSNQQQQQQQPWGFGQATSSFEANDSTSAANHHYATSSWGFKDTKAGTMSYDISPDLGTSAQVSHPGSWQIAGGVESSSHQQDTKQYPEPGNSGPFESDQHINWSP